MTDRKQLAANSRGSARNEKLALQLKRGELLPQTKAASLEEQRADHVQELLSLIRPRKDTTNKDKLAKIQNTINTLSEIAPQGGVERLLAVQMIGCDEAAKECLRRAFCSNQSLQATEMYLKHSEKLTNMVTNLVRTLDKHRGKGQQKVTVEHVYVEAGANAVVGNVVGGSSHQPPIETELTISPHRDAPNRRKKVTRPPPRMKSNRRQG